MKTKFSLLLAAASVLALGACTQQQADQAATDAAAAAEQAAEATADAAESLIADVESSR